MSKPNRGAPRRVRAKPVAPDWKAPFLAALAETSNVARAAKDAGLKGTALVYEARRKSRDFAAKWQAALCEGYDNLEMELLRRLREGEIRRAPGAKIGVRTFDNATAFRLLMVHREAVAKERAVRANVSAAEVRVAIERKVTALKLEVLAREEEAERAGREGDGE
jgi:hypothetical protein